MTRDSESGFVKWLSSVFTGLAAVVGSFLGAAVAAVTPILEFVGVLFEKYKFARRSMLYWAMGMITATVASIILKPTIVTEHSSNIFIAVIGLLMTAIGFYQWSRNADDIRRREERDDRED